MSKTVSSALKSHMAQYVTTLCTLWSIVRTDGVSFYFTDHDQDIVFGGNTYLAETGYTRTAIMSDQQMSVDNMEIFGILSNTTIAEEDLRNGVYNYAAVTILLVNWADLTMGSMTLRSGWFGEIIVTPNGYFTTEIRGLTQALAVNFGDVISALCRADFGDTRCKVPVEPPVWTSTSIIQPGSYVRASNLGTPPADPAAGIIFYTVHGGTTGGTQPTWNLTGPTTDGSITDWQAQNSFTKQGAVTAVVSRKIISVSGLTIPQNALYGPETNILGSEYLISCSGINSGGFPTGQPTNILTCNIELSGGSSGNTLRFNEDVPGGGSLVSDSGGGTSHITVVGALENINASLTQGLYWTNASTFSDTLTIVATDTSGHSFSVTIQLPQVSQYYANATLTWLTGANAGKAMEVNNFANDQITLWLSMPFLPSIGDTFRIFPGCDKTRTTCHNFGNVANFHGEPDLPGQDFLYSPNLSF